MNKNSKSGKGQKSKSKTAKKDDAIEIFETEDSFPTHRTEAVIPKNEKRSLRYDLTAKEVHDLSIQLAQSNKEVVAIEEEKKSIASQYKARIDEKKASINRLSNIVSDGFEMREVDCKIEWHKPEQGKKTIIRTDIDKVHAIEKMSDYEWNLFNQPEDEGVSEILQAERDKLRGK